MQSQRVVYEQIVGQLWDQRYVTVIKNYVRATNLNSVNASCLKTVRENLLGRFYICTRCLKCNMMMNLSRSMFQRMFLKFTLERTIFCEEYIWLEKVASWHDVRLRREILYDLCSFISQSSCYALQCMRIDVASLEVSLVGATFLQVSKFW